MPCSLRTAAIVSLVLLAASAASAQPRTREECEAAHPASWGREGKDVVWVPTFDAVVMAMLSMTKVAPEDVVLDLGAGDGKIAIAAAKEPYRAKAVGIEYDAGMASLARCLVSAEGLTDRVRIVEGDIFKEDFGDATVVTLYLLPHLNLCVRHRILALAPGARVASHQYPMADWEPDESLKIQGRDVFSWVVPARVDGVWRFQIADGSAFTVDLRQTFAKLTGEITRGAAITLLQSATLNGTTLRFAFEVADGPPARFSGTVRGAEITGVLTSGATARTAKGRLQGSLRRAAWAEMAEGCQKYFDR